MTESVQQESKKTSSIFKWLLLVGLLVVAATIIFINLPKKAVVVQAVTEFSVDQQNSYIKDFRCITKTIIDKTEQQFEYTTETPEGKQYIRENCIPIVK